MDLASATDLEQWAQRRDAQDTLPQLVRRLIAATADGLTRLSVRAGEGVGLPGWDGVAEAAGATPFVPSGLSVWEMGVGEPGAKAQSDYKKRTEDPGGVDPATTTFVFVTPRRWDGKDAWVARKQKKAAAPPAAGKTKHVWNAIRVVDADDLEAWLETAPAVHAWLSALLGKDPYEAESLEGWWTTWSEATSPALPPAVPLSGRDAEADRLRAFLAEPAASTSIVADSQDDALAFLAATLIGDVPRLAQALVVRTPAAWRRLSTWPTPLLLIPTFERPLVSIAVRNGHHVVLPIGREAAGTSGTVLPRLRRAGVADALTAAGLPPDRASALATLGRRSLQALRRTLAVNADALTPQWARPQHARDIALATLLGSWTDNVPSDRKAVETVAGQAYGDFTRTLTQYANDSDPPVRRVGDVWLVAAKADTWERTGRALSTDDLDRFRETAIGVLGEDDPALDLHAEQRGAANILGKQRPHSSALIGGIADTLALLAATSDIVPLVGTRDGQTEAVVIARTLLEAANEDATGRRWHALANVLPRLAEAAPGSFLSAVATGSETESAPVLHLFQDAEGASFMVSSPHSYVLWALETVAWTTVHLPSAALALARLSRLEPGGTTMNRPFNSLVSVLLLWHPGTSATIDERLQVLDLLRKREPDVAWRLTLALIPDGEGMTSRTSSPIYHDWKPEALERPIVADLVEAVDAVVKRGLLDADADGVRLAALLRKVTSGVLPARNHVVAALEAVDPAALSSDGRRALHRVLRDLVTRHRRFSTATWAMPSDAIDRLAPLVEKFEPTAAADRHGWLFERRAIDAFSTDVEGETHTERGERLGAAQDAALNEVVGEVGVTGLPAWAETLSETEFAVTPIGTSLGRIRADDREALGLLASTDPTAQRVGIAFATSAARGNGPAWIAGVLTEIAPGWTPETTALFLRSLPTDLDVWAYAEAQGEDVDRAFWGAVHPFALPTEDPRALDAAAKLLDVGRPRAVIQHLQHVIENGAVAVPDDLLAGALEQAVITADAPFDSTTAHYIGLHLDRLDKAGFDSARLVQLEWAYLPLFRFEGRSSGILHRALASDPEFFVQALSFAYRPRGEDPVELSEAESHRAQNAYHLLDSWRTVPGTDDDGAIDAEALTTWIAETRRLLREANRVEVGEGYIGRVLRYGPDPDPAPDADGPRPSRRRGGASKPPTSTDWPAEVIRDAIETAASDHLERGFQMEVHNSRGITSRGLTEGGAQERALADYYRRCAASVGLAFPRTRAMLTRIAESYDHEAEGHDRDAELTEDTWR